MTSFWRWLAWKVPSRWGRSILDWRVQAADWLSVPASASGQEPHSHLCHLPLFTMYFFSCTCLLNQLNRSCARVFYKQKLLQHSLCTCRFLSLEMEFLILLLLFRGSNLWLYLETIVIVTDTTLMLHLTIIHIFKWCWKTVYIIKNLSTVQL